jgi:hypothetical protein
MLAFLVARIERVEVESIADVRKFLVSSIRTKAADMASLYRHLMSGLQLYVLALLFITMR